MKFTLLFYTDNWEIGPSVELSGMPALGSVVWINDRRERYEHDMYYVDNIMYADSSINEDETVYLYVRPYTGYSRYAPKTESDRLAENIDKLLGEQRKTNELLESIGAALDRFHERFEKYDGDTCDNSEQVNERLRDILYALETITERME